MTLEVCEWRVGVVAASRISCGPRPVHRTASWMPGSKGKLLLRLLVSVGLFQRCPFLLVPLSFRSSVAALLRSATAVASSVDSVLTASSMGTVKSNSQHQKLDGGASKSFLDVHNTMLNILKRTHKILAYSWENSAIR